MVVATCFQRLFGVIKYADFLCGKVISREATDTEGVVFFILRANVVIEGSFRMSREMSQCPSYSLIRNCLS